MKLLKMVSIALIAVLLTQCYPEGPTYVDEVDLVLSSYDPAYDFSAKHTFAMPDKIIKVDADLVNGGEPAFVKDQYASVILGSIRQNMLNMGWVEVDIANRPDVMVVPAESESTTYYTYGWGYYGWWYGGYYPPGGWYYPYPTYDSYTSGSLIVSMVDPNDLSANDKVRLTWTFIVNGLLQGSTTELNARMTKGINQGFAQSPYLKK